MRDREIINLLDSMDERYAVLDRLFRQKELATRILQAGESEFNRLAKAIEESDRQIFKDSSMVDAIVKAFEEGGRIHAIKLYRLHNRTSLTEARDTVNRVLAHASRPV